MPAARSDRGHESRDHSLIQFDRKSCLMRDFATPACVVNEPIKQKPDVSRGTALPHDNGVTAMVCACVVSQDVMLHLQSEPIARALSERRAKPLRDVERHRTAFAQELGQYATLTPDAGRTGVASNSAEGECPREGSRQGEADGGRRRGCLYTLR